MSNNTVVRVSCSDQVLKILEAPVIASGGLSEVRVEFEFCSKWDGLAKIAVFYQDETEPYYALVGEDDSCIVPWEVCLSEGTFFFSVFGDKDGIRRTSATLRYKVKKGAITESLSLSEPTPEIYDQILAELAAMRAENRELAEQTTAFVEEANKVLAEDQAEHDSFMAEANQVIGGVMADIESIKADIADLKYVAIKLNSFTAYVSGFGANNKLLVEMGKVVKEVLLRWTVNKTPKSLTLDGSELDASSKEKTVTSSEGWSSGSKSWSLVAKDERGASSTMSCTMEFVNGVYRGVLTDDEPIDSAAIRGLSKILQASKGTQFTANPTSGQRLTYAHPTRYGTPKFNIGGFDYEWNKTATIDFTNAFGYTESYDIWQHGQIITSSVTVKVT